MEMGGEGRGGLRGAEGEMRLEERSREEKVGEERKEEKRIGEKRREKERRGERR